MTTPVEIRHPDWLQSDHPMEASAITNTLRMYRKGQLPRQIAGLMIVNAAKRPLRAVYGSNLRAGLAIVWDALVDKITNWRYRVRLLTPQERCWEREFDEMDDDIFLEKLSDGLRRNGSIGVEEPGRNPQAAPRK
jgi:hypothetical protein